MSETILTRLFQRCLTNIGVEASHRSLAIKKMDEAVSYINTKALNGSDWAYKFKEKNSNQIRPIKLTKARVRNILNLGAWESGDVEGLVRILVTGQNSKYCFVACINFG